jgi:hypothetical protein
MVGSVPRQSPAKTLAVDANSYRHTINTAGRRPGTNPKDLRQIDPAGQPKWSRHLLQRLAAQP